MRSESSVFRWGFTAGWAAVLVCYLAALSDLWNLYGIPYGFAAAILGAEVLVWWQTFGHVDRAKRGLMALLLVAWHMDLITLALSFLFLPEAYRRWAVIAFPAVVSLFALQLWWKWSRRDLLLLVIAALLCVFSLIWGPIQRSSQSLTYSCLATASWFGVHSATVLPGADPLYVALGISVTPEDVKSGTETNELCSVLLRTRDGVPRCTRLPSGEWNIIGGFTSNTIALAREYSADESSSETISEIYTTSGTGQVCHLLTFPKGCSWGQARYRPMPFFSAERTYVLSPVTSETVSRDQKPEKTHAIGVTNRKTGELVAFRDFGIDSARRWLDDERLVAVNMIEKTVRSEHATTTTYEHDVWLLNARTGESRLQQKLVLGDGSLGLFPWWDGKYAFRCGQIINLETLVLTPTEYGPRFRRNFTAWQPNAGVAAWVVTSKDGERILVYGPEGFRSSCNVPQHAEVTALRVSPRGDRVLVAYERQDLLLPSSTVEILNTNSGELRKVDRIPYDLSRCLGGDGSDRYSQIQWTPDGDAIYPTWGMDLLNDNLVAASQFRVTAGMGFGPNSTFNHGEPN